MQNLWHSSYKTGEKNIVKNASSSFQAAIILFQNQEVMFLISRSNKQ